MAYEIYASPDAGLLGRYCLRDPVTKRCFRDAIGRLYTYPDAVTARAAMPIASKQASEPEAFAQPVKRHTVKAGGE